MASSPVTRTSVLHIIGVCSSVCSSQARISLGCLHSPSLARLDRLISSGKQSGHYTLVPCCCGTRAYGFAERMLATMSALCLQMQSGVKQMPSRTRWMAILAKPSVLSFSKEESICSSTSTNHIDLRRYFFKLMYDFLVLACMFLTSSVVSYPILLRKYFPHNGK